MNTNTQEPKINQEIARRNKLFKKATKAQKRVLIAKDIIEQIKAGKFNAESGTWARISEFNDPYELRDIGSETPVQPVLLKAETRCDCCALGAMLLSCTMFANKETVEDYRFYFDDMSEILQGRQKTKSGLERIFSKEQMILIENAFELGYGYSGIWNLSTSHFKKQFGSSIDIDRLVRAAAFGERYSDSAKRLLAIMRNIIKNQGQFIP